MNSNIMSYKYSDFCFVCFVNYKEGAFEMNMDYPGASCKTVAHREIWDDGSKSYGSINTKTNCVCIAHKKLCLLQKLRFSGPIM